MTPVTMILINNDNNTGFSGHLLRGNLEKWNLISSHVIDWETEAHRGQITCPRSHNEASWVGSLIPPHGGHHGSVRWEASRVRKGVTCSLVRSRNEASELPSAAGRPHGIHAGRTLMRVNSSHVP